jgi:hypothetical protein
MEEKSLRLLCFLKELKKNLRTFLPNGNDPFAITNVPPHISILTQMHGMFEKEDKEVP